MEDIKLIYGYDPLCGWCYAFSNQIGQVQQRLPNLKIEVVYGGLVVGERVGPIKNHAGYLLQGEQQLFARTGIAFGKQFKDKLLHQGTYVSDSEPPCRAVWVMQKLKPEHAFAFANELPTAHYWDGIALDDPAQLARIASRYGVEDRLFVETWQSEDAKKGVVSAFQLARTKGVVSYPTLWLERDGQKEDFVKGWQTSETIVEKLNELVHA